ncbi:MAG: PilN domain-containing protein [Terrimicrobiaceae bacterium]|nr:PilN domain-containing protein [Terrimicrobiaceae bacterium]
MKRQTADAILRPGATHWELWKFNGKGAPAMEENPDRRSLAQTQHLLVALPARDVLSVPIWISSEADPAEMAELELSSRHLLRRNAAPHALPLESKDGRSLVLAIATADDALAAPYFAPARQFDIAARLWDPGSADLLVWRELGELCFAFVRSGKCVFFSGSGEPTPGPAFCGAVSRTALRLKAEGVLDRMPVALRLIGAFTDDEKSALAGGLRVQIDHSAEIPPPRLPESAIDAAPPAAMAEATRRTTRKRLFAVGLAGGAVYLAAVALLAGSLAWQNLQLAGLRNAAAQDAPKAESARQDVAEWREFRQAFDPGTFALDQLAAVAQALPGEQVRLTQFSLDNGRLLVTGEAADVSQAYAFFERVKASPDLQDYDWTNRQPQLAGKSKVRFEMEGVRPDAQTENE